MQTTIYRLFFLLLWVRAAAADYGVPQLDGIDIDGNLSDWAEGGLRVETLADEEQMLAVGSDLSASLRLGWDQRGLLVGVEVGDDAHSETGDTLSLWSGDSVELYISPQRGSIDIYQLAFAPGMDPANPALRHHVHDRRISAATRRFNRPVRAVRKRTGNSYVMEVLIPLQNIGLQAARDQRFAFQIAVNDVDEAGGNRHQVLWYPHPGAYADSEQMYALHLVEDEHATLSGVAVGQYERFRRAKVHIVTTAERAGQPIELRGGTTRWAQGHLKSVGDQSRGKIALPMPASPADYDDLQVYAGDQYLCDVVLPDLEQARQQLLEATPLRAQPSVFSQSSFPPIDFANPSLVEDLIGPYQIEATYYDADYNRVTAPDRPGRYGAIVEVSSASGQTLRRYVTLFHHTDPIRWWNAPMRAEVELPPRLGIRPEVLAAQPAAVADFLRWMLAESAYEHSEFAPFLAALFEATTEEPIDPQTQDREWWYGLRRQLGQQALYPHWVHLPSAYPQDEDASWPMLVFLHGSGERGDVLDLVKMHGPPKLAEAGQDLPFITVSPQCPLGQNWLPRQVVDLVDSLSAAYRVDRDRIYLTGLSMGGYGTWDIAARYPNTFAAIAPICGGGNPATAARFAHLPTWVFHGALDSVVPIEESQHMVDALSAAGGNARFTVYPEAGHDSWTEAYNTPELYDWFLAQKRK